MNLYLARHAEAVPVGGPVKRDQDRPLSHRGERDAQLLGNIIGHVDPAISLILSSPYLRARQTADQLRGGLSNHADRRESLNLRPGFLPEDLLEELFSLSGVESVVAVGHQPDLGTCISSLIGNAAPASIEVVPGSITKLTLKGTPAHPQVRLNWLLTPELVRSIIPQK